MRGGDDTDEFMKHEKEAADIIKQNIMSAISDIVREMLRSGQKKIIVSSKNFLKPWRNELYRETAWDGIFNSTDPDTMAMMIQFRSTYTPEYSRKIKDEDGKLIRVFYNTEVMDKIEKDLKIEDIMVEAAKEKSKKIFGDYGVSFQIKKKRNMFWRGGKRKTRRKKKNRTRRKRRKKGKRSRRRRR